MHSPRCAVWRLTSRGLQRAGARRASFPTREQSESDHAHEELPHDRPGQDRLRRSRWRCSSGWWPRAKPAQRPNLLLFCEHPHVITLGRNGKREHLRVAEDLAAPRGRGVSSHQSRRRYHVSRPGTDRRLSDPGPERDPARRGLVRAAARRSHDSGHCGVRRRALFASRDARASGCERSAADGLARRPATKNSAPSACTSAAGSPRTDLPTTFPRICAISI